MLDDAENTFHHAAQPTECLQALQHLPYWRERAAYAEKNRRLSSDTFTELFDNTWLDLLSPQAPATSSGHWPTLVEISRIAARACSSTGWILALVGSHSCIVRRLPPPAKSDCTQRAPSNYSLPPQPVPIAICTGKPEAYG